MDWGKVVLAWQFPKKTGGQKSELITGRRIEHTAVGGQHFFLHFKCKNADEARKCSKWRVEPGVVQDESVHVILRPANTVVAPNANAFEVKCGKAYPILLKFEGSRPSTGKNATADQHTHM